MKINELLKSQPKWTMATGKLNEIVISSRVRLSRNLEGFKFTWKLEKNELDEILNLVKQNNQIYMLKDFSSIERRFLYERKIIGRNGIDDGENKGVIFTEFHSISINEDDHIKIRSITPGLSLRNAYEIANNLEENLSYLGYAFSERFGYLTVSPSETGTGLRVACFLHLPAILYLNKMHEIIDKVEDEGFYFYGLYDEQENINGAIFQITNKIPMGKKEEEIISDLENVVNMIAKEEIVAREKLLSKIRIYVEDKVMRALGIITHAKVLNLNEAMNLLSGIRFGIISGIINNIDLSKINSLFIQIQPAHIKLMADEKISNEETDIYRASFIQEQLNYLL